MPIGKAGTINVFWRKDASATVYGRLVSDDGSGTAVLGEGKALQRADIQSITYRVYDEANSKSTVEGSVNVTTDVFDTLQTSAIDPAWTGHGGFNFKHRLGPSAFPKAGKMYVAEYKITTTGGTVGFATYRGPALPLP